MLHPVTYRSNKHGWMTTPIFTEFLNSLNNKMKWQNRHILMFLDNCSSHPHVELSNIKLVFYPKNTTSRLQAMDQGVIANLKKNYAKHMLNVDHIETKKAKDVTDIVREIKIFDAILHAKVAWEQVKPECILKCSEIVDPAEFTQSPPLSPTNDPEEDEFAVYFEELLNVPWDEYLAIELEQPARALDTQAYCIEGLDQEQDQATKDLPPTPHQP